jgi:hypothetical protein
MRTGEGRSLFRRPVALAPIIMSLAGLALVLIHYARFGIVREADEGTSAHLFQLLMAAQVPVILVFAVRWLPARPGKALLVLAAQAAAAAAAFAAVYYLT